ncbi:HD domain-containing phosphohydrolase [Desulfovibrio inopinatus]|uniref:HD domain-containing phosphohydrolase n=1 Tax=Desulfovibrio inopinatus TaxID=102109 RepID=UPI000427B0ED|nr:HD domain-containing phosphohydrolase [Desulfovibrio inopinatus]
MYAELFQNAPIGMYRKSLDGHFLAVNNAMASMFGYDSPEAFVQAMHTTPDHYYLDEDERADIMERLKETHQIENIETQAICSDNNIIWIRETIQLIQTDEAAEPIIIGYVEDTSFTKSTEWALAEVQEKYRDIVDNSVEGIFQATLDHRIIMANISMAQMLGYENPEVMLAQSCNMQTDIFYDPTDKLRLDIALEKNTIVTNFEARVRRQDGSIIWASVNARAIRDGSGKVILHEGSMFDITDKKLTEDKVHQSLENFRTLLLDTARSLAKTVEIRDMYTSGHQENVAELAGAIACMMGYNDDAIEGIRLAGLLHDIGKTSIPAEFLCKQGSLDVFEMGLIREHPVTGYEILQNIPFPWPIASMILQHHERLDGSGYPKGLQADDILPEARILAVADVIEAMSSHRPYRPSLGLVNALHEIETNAGRLYDADAVRAALKIFEGVDESTSFEDVLKLLPKSFE